MTGLVSFMSAYDMSFFSHVVIQILIQTNGMSIAIGVNVVVLLLLFFSVGAKFQTTFVVCFVFFFFVFFFVLFFFLFLFVCFLNYRLE